MSIIKQVAKNSLIYGLGDLLTKLVGFLLIPLYTHYLTTAEYGVLELLDLTSYIVGFLLAMGIAQAVMRFYFEYESEEERNRVVSVALLTVWLASAGGLVVLQVCAPWFSEAVFQSADYGPHFRILFATLAVTISNEIPLQYLRIRQLAVRFISISLCRVSLSLSLNILFIVFYGLGVQGILLSGLIANATVGCYLLYFTLTRVRLSFSLSLLETMLRYGFPLIWTWLGSFTLHFFDRFLLQRMASLDEVGVYALGYKFGFLLNVLLLTPFINSWGPKQFEIARRPDAPRIFAQVFTYYCFLQALLTVGISVVIGDVISAIADPAYARAADYVPLLLVAYNFNGVYSILQFGLLQQQRTKQLALIALSAGALNIACNLALIPSYGAWGAVWSTVISFAFLGVVTYRQAQRLFYIPLEWRRLATLVAAASFLYLVASSIRIESPLLSVAARGAVACTLPLLVYLLRFFRPDELASMKALFVR